MSIVEILPPHMDANGATYRALVYLANNERLRLEAHVSEPLRRRLAGMAAKALAWTRDHVRLPAGPLRDLMAGSAPACGCDLAGDTFRAAALMAADIGEAWEGEWPDEDPLVAWEYDAWQGAEDRMLSDVGMLIEDEIGQLRAAGRPLVLRRPAGPHDAELIRIFRAILRLG